MNGLGNLYARGLPALKGTLGHSKANIVLDGVEPRMDSLPR